MIEQGRQTRFSIWVACPLATGCDGPLSTLAPAGGVAADTAAFFWVMTGAAAAVWLFVMGTAVYAARAAPRGGAVRTGRRLILAGGVALPLVLLSALSFFALRQINAALEAGDGLVIHVTGERWWWRVRYEAPSGLAASSANEVRLPAGERVELRLDATDVIHSFWIPSLGGKMDMIPGRTNRLVLQAELEGRYGGACAEFCGLSHTFMDFDVVVMAPEDFSRWLAAQAQPAAPPADALAERGRELFLANGCGACHRVAGTEATGVIGPDLSHLGGRGSIAAGALPADVPSLASWIANPGAVKPGALMPGYPMLEASDLVALAAWLEGLE